MQQLNYIVRLSSNMKNPWLAELCKLGNLACFLVDYQFFSKSIFLKNSFRNTIIISNSLDPDQAGQNVGPDLGPNCLQR